MRLETTVDIVAPVERVWALTVDVEAWPTFTPTISEVALLGPGQVVVGARALVSQPGQPDRTWTIEVVDDRRRFVWSTSSMGMRVVAGHAMVPVGTPASSTTRSTLTLDLRGPVAAVLGLVMAPALRSALRKENAGLKAAAEA